jgi:putative tryptophan/tyrosine transport system substrate-binding protein
MLAKSLPTRQKNKMDRRSLLALIAAAAASPMLIRAQEVGHIPRIGVLWHAGNVREESPYFEALIEGFEAIGYTNGKIEFEHRFPNEKPERFESMAAELVALAPDVIVGVSSGAAYVKRATSTIPIVFMYVPDPIGANLVETIRHPGENATGLSNFGVDLSPKRLEYLKQAVPSLSKVALLLNAANKISSLYVEQSNAAAGKLGLTCRAYQVADLDELDSAFDAMAAAGMEAVVINAEALFYLGKEKIAKLALTHRLPSCSWVREVSEAGTLLSYGADQRGIARRVPYYVDRILQGEKPGDIPVEQPAEFQFCVNLTTAKALGITLPPILLAQADEVFE